MRRQGTALEKIFTNHISGKGLVSRIHKELSKLKNEKTGTRFEQTPHQRQYINGKQAQGCLTSLAIREMQTQTTTRYHLTPTRMVQKNKPLGNTECGEWLELSLESSLAVPHS